MTATDERVVAAVTDVRRRVERQGRDPESLRIVAVTKGFSADEVSAVRAAGLRDVGENYAQELFAKAAHGPAGTVWHFLGPIQRNKVARLSGPVKVWQAVDRPAAARAVAAAAPGAEVMVQVNVLRDPARPGCFPDQVADLVSEVRALPVDLSGLMTVGPAGDPDGSRACFRWLAAKASELGLRELSMGMSDDFEIAAAEGATTLRLGRILFGPRPERATVQR